MKDTLRDQQQILSALNEKGLRLNLETHKHLHSLFGVLSEEPYCNILASIVFGRDCVAFDFFFTEMIQSLSVSRLENTLIYIIKLTRGNPDLLYENVMAMTEETRQDFLTYLSNPDLDFSISSVTGDTINALESHYNLQNMVVKMMIEENVPSADHPPMSKKKI